MGWLQVQQLDGSTLAAGQTVTVTLASQAATSHRCNQRAFHYCPVRDLGRTVFLRWLSAQ